MIYAERLPSGRLRNIQHFPAKPEGDWVELVAMPAGFGPFVYDAQTQTAVPATLDEGEKLDRLSLPPRVLAALVVGALPLADTLPAERAWARGVLLDARDRARDARAALAQARVSAP